MNILINMQEAIVSSNKKNKHNIEGYRFQQVQPMCQLIQDKPNLLLQEWVLEINKDQSQGQMDRV